jgi:hypothetical protein
MVMVLVLTAATIASVTGWRQTSAQLSVANTAATHHAATQQATINSLLAQVSALQSQTGGLSSVISHLGICFNTFTNNGNGQVSSVSLSPPGPRDHCTNGSQFISVVPPRSVTDSHAGS